MAQSHTAKDQPPGRSERYLTNVLWSWFGVGVALFAGLLVSPYIIRKLGAEGYGLWALLFSTVGYYALLDLGFRSAAVRYSAHFCAKGNPEKLNEIINSALVYFLSGSLVLLLITLYLFRSVYRFFQISPAYQHDFSLLILLIGSTWSLSMIFTLFGGCLEGLQRFDVSNRVWVIVLLLRSVGCVGVLAMGYGLLAMGWIVVISQFVGFALYYLGLRKAFPSLSISPASAKFSVLKEMGHYGLHSFLANASNMVLDYTAPLLVGHFLPVAYVGYYSLPVRLLQYTADAADRVGLVTTASAAELQAKGHSGTLSRLGIFSNRYCFTMFVPLTILLLAYGREVLTVWVGAAFASQSARLLPILLLATSTTLVGQANSSTILFGLAKHQRYAYGLMVEAIVNVVAMIFVIPRYGILGAAWVASVLMILTRGLYTPWLVCRILNFSLSAYLGSIFVRPTLTGLPVLALAYWAKGHGLAGRNLPELFAIGLVIALLYYGAAIISCVRPEHRSLILEWLAKQWRVLLRREV